MPPFPELESVSHPLNKGELEPASHPSNKRECQFPRYELQILQHNPYILRILRGTVGILRRFHFLTLKSF